REVQLKDLFNLEYFGILQRSKDVAWSSNERIFCALDSKHRLSLYKNIPDLKYCEVVDLDETYQIFVWGEARIFRICYKGGNTISFRVGNYEVFQRFHNFFEKSVNGSTVIKPELDEVKNSMY